MKLFFFFTSARAVLLCPSHCCVTDCREVFTPSCQVQIQYRRPCPCCIRHCSLETVNWKYYLDILAQWIRCLWRRELSEFSIKISADIYYYVKVKRVEFSLSTLWRRVRGAEVQVRSGLTSALDGGEWLTPPPRPRPRPGRFTPGTHWTGNLGGPHNRSGRFGAEKSPLHLPGFEPISFHPVD